MQSEKNGIVWGKLGGPCDYPFPFFVFQSLGFLPNFRPKKVANQAYVLGFHPDLLPTPLSQKCAPNITATIIQGVFLTAPPQKKVKVCKT